MWLQKFCKGKLAMSINNEKTDIGVFFTLIKILQ